MPHSINFFAIGIYAAHWSHYSTCIMYYVCVCVGIQNQYPICNYILLLSLDGRCVVSEYDSIYSCYLYMCFFNWPESVGWGWQGLVSFNDGDTYSFYSNNPPSRLQCLYIFSFWKMKRQRVCIFAPYVFHISLKLFHLIIGILIYWSGIFFPNENLFSMIFVKMDTFKMYVKPTMIQM